MNTTLPDRDVMQVCRNGHVITDRLYSCPEQGVPRCDRCGADTLDQCQTCGQAIPGAGAVAGLLTVGRQAPPACCSCCGAPFPWTSAPIFPADDPLTLLEPTLRRLPRVVAALRSRHGDRPAFSVRDEFDLEDLMRSVLPLFFDNIRPESRTPRYAAATRTDLLLPEQRLAIVLKWAGSAPPATLADQWAEDLLYYEQRGYSAVLGLVADPGALLPDAGVLEHAWSRTEGAVRLNVIILQ